MSLDDVDAAIAEALTDATRTALGAAALVVADYAVEYPHTADHCANIVHRIQLRSATFALDPEAVKRPPSVPQEAQTPASACHPTPERSETRTEAETGDT